MATFSLLFSTVLACTLIYLTHADSNVETENRVFKKCDLYDGKWVYDKSYPLYNVQQCPLISQPFNCTGNGRLDLQYQKYRWQPNNCNLIRWNGREIGKRMMGKSIMFVGDSLSMNQWQSLACIIRAAYSRSPYYSAKRGLLSTITFPQLNLTLKYTRNAFIVDVVQQKGVKVLNLNSISSNAKQWLQNDILVFDTWHWWLYTGRKQAWDMIQDGNVMRKDMNRFEAYEKALRTWSRWINKNVNTNKVKVFFQGVSPDHWNASDWGKPETQRCGEQGQPLKQAMDGSDGTNRADIILKEVLKSMKNRVYLLDINKLSQFRVDGHPSIYGNPRKIGMDCTHWCLPGVPDAWNQLLYATLFTF